MCGTYDVVTYAMYIYIPTYNFSLLLQPLFPLTSDCVTFYFNFAFVEERTQQRETD